jgi:hypothetical protein
MHNERLANPMDPHARDVSKIAKKRSKTESDYEMLAKLEFKGGLYISEETGPYVPGTWIDKMLETSGKKEKLGTTMKAYARCMEDAMPIGFDGPRTIEGMWDKHFYDQRCVGVQTRKTVRTRPCFREWTLECTILYDETALEHEQIIRAMDRAGQAIGLGDYRPRFGRFTIEVLANELDRRAA